MKKIYTVCLLLALVGFGGCKKLQDMAPVSEYTDKTVWSSQADVVAAINACYLNWESVNSNNMPILLRDCLTDNSVYQSAIFGFYESKANGSYNPALSTSNGDIYDYATIARCNWFLDNIYRASSTAIDSDLRKRIIAEARFLRAYRYFLLAQMYRDVPLVLHIQSIKESRLVKQSSQAVINAFILSEMEEIAPDLPVTYASYTDIGRITRGAALALKARLELYTKNYTACIATCNQLMTAPFSYNVYSDFEGLFRPQNANNSEVILSVSYVLNYGSKNVLSDLAVFPAGQSNVAVTQSLVDAFETTNGKTIDQDATYNPLQPYLNRDPRLDATIVRPGLRYNGIVFDPITPPSSGGGGGSVGGGGGSVGGGGGSVGGGGGSVGGGGGSVGGGGGSVGGGGGSFGGGVSPGGGSNNGYTLSPSNYKLNFPNSSTGYNFKKYLSVLNDYWNTPFGLNQLSNTGGNVIAIRYAEVLLTYAEAKIEAGQIDQSVYDAINKVRQRITAFDFLTGQTAPVMPAVTTSTHPDQNAMRALVRRERRVEFAGEGLRWFDIVRWQNGPDVIKDVYDCLNGSVDPFSGMVTLTPNSSTVKYHRTFSPKYYVFPIPVAELQKNTNLVQNTEYR